MNNISLEYVLDGYTDEFALKYKYKGTVLRGDPRKFSLDLETFETLDDDVWLCGYMRSGTTWTKEMIWRIANDFNLENTELLRSRFPYFDLFIMNSAGDRVQDYEDILTRLKNMPSPRFLKTHLPIHLLPRDLLNGRNKIIYIARNPKDVCVSLFYYYKHFYNFQGDLLSFVNLFLTDKLLYAPYWDNVLGYWHKRKDLNILFLKYEAMKTDLQSVIRETAKFFGKNPRDEQVAALAKHLEFENFRKNPSLNNEDIDMKFSKRFGIKNDRGYVRKGIVGQWKEEMSPDTIRRFTEWIEKNIRNTDYVC